MLNGYHIVLECVAVILHVTPVTTASFRMSKLNQRTVGHTKNNTVPNVSLGKCLESCLYRQQCNGINYSKMNKFCEVLADDDGEDYSIEALSYVSIDRSDMVETARTKKVCNQCADGVCDPVLGTCNVRECAPVLIANAAVFGNIVNQGSRLMVVCNKHYKLSNGVGTLVCQPNGTWSSSPVCLWDCGEPNTAIVKATVSPGETTNGTVRTYTCYNGYFVSGNRNKTMLNVTCHLGGSWDRWPRCVKDCGEPPSTESRYASLLEGDGIVDQAKRVYTCLPGHVLFLFDGHTANGIEYSGEITNKTKRTILCDGYFPKWKSKNFICVKDCINRNTTNVQTVDYQVDGDNVTATFTCSEGYSVFDYSIKLELDSFVTVCNKALGAWTNLTLCCGTESTKGKAADGTLGDGIQGTT